MKVCLYFRALNTVYAGRKDLSVPVAMAQSIYVEAMATDKLRVPEGA